MSKQSAENGRTGGQDPWFVRCLETVVSVLVMPVAVLVHRRTFRRMSRDWDAGHRP